MQAWPSLAQWIGTDKGVGAIGQVEELWAGYGATARASILNAYYTDPTIIDTTWAWLRTQGITAGHGFEPGCGRGDWMRAAPASVSFDAVDIDPISVRVAGLLTGRNVVESRIEAWDLSRSSRPDVTGYDLVVGNVPFSSTKPGINNPHRDNVHNLAIARSVDMLRPGGVATVITSRYALDAPASLGWRTRLADQVDLVAAFRLPAGTHRSAGTSVVTDLLVLRRPLPGEQRPPADWIDTVEVTVGEDTFQHNHHFAAHPQRVLGEYQAGGAYRRENLNVIAARPASELLAEALATISVEYRPTGSAPQIVAPAIMSATGRRLPAGSIVVDPTSPTGFSRDLAPHKVAKKNRDQVAALCSLRDRVLDYLDDPTDDGRAELADSYAAYRAVYPPLNTYTLKPAPLKAGETRSVTVDDGDAFANEPSVGAPDGGEDVEVIGNEITNMQRSYPSYDGFRYDPSWWSVAAIEDHDDDTMTAAPAAILQRPIMADHQDRWPASADSLTLAVANSLARFHRIDEHYVAAQLDVDVATGRDHLQAVAFEVPEGGWEIAATYLAGDVVGKLDHAQQAALTDDRFARNVTALTGVLPTPLTQAEIVPEMGVTWLTAQDMTQFVRDIAGGGSVEVKYFAPTGKWTSEGWSQAGPAQFRTSRYGVVEQVVRACNAQSTVVERTERDDNGRERKVIDLEAGAAEQLARDNLNEALQTWCWADPQRASELTARYNRLYNRYQPVAYDGAHLTLPGLATDFTPRPHQKDAVWRILTSTDTGVLMAHGVGAGKTAAMIIAGHEARRTGRVNGTTMFAVPGNMVEQFARDYLRLYPAARVITPRGTKVENLREFAARVASGDFDAAICSHNALKKIPLHPDTQAAQLEARIDELVGGNPDETLNRRAARNMEKQISNMREKLTELTNAAVDTTISYFDRMNIGMLFVDELHLAKNIGLGTERTGLPLPKASQLAEAVLARADVVRKLHGAGAVVGATATPITNSPAEMWVAARLIAPGVLAKAGCEHFDAFAANFLSPVEAIEHTAGGGLKNVVRLADYRNFPDLARMFRSFCDVKRTDSLGFRLPVLDGGSANVHVVQPSPDQLVVADWARERSQGMHLDLTDGVKDPVIAILGVARAAALHPATVSADTCRKWATTGHPHLTFSYNEPNPKLIEAADTIAAIHHRSASWEYPGSDRPGAAQVVFCDAGVPKGTGDSVYSVLTQHLVDRGVAREQISWVHDWPDPAGRQPLWDRVRGGQVRILIGSTMQMGVGVNIQSRLYAAHELTAPYRPDWLEQGEGRMIRQGNHHDRVELHRYVSERTADATSWQILHRKAKFIHLAMSHPDQLTRELRDESVETPAEQFAQIAALATGDQRHIELAAVTSTVTRLERAQRAHQAAIANQQRSIRSTAATIERCASQIDIIAGLQPIPVGEHATIGSALTALRWGEHTIVLDGITHHARRDDYQLALTIPDTGLSLKIERGRLNPADGGTGLGIALRNFHGSFPGAIDDLRAQSEGATRQRDAEIARPVPAEFPRNSELAELTHRRDQLIAALTPTPAAPANATGASDGLEPGSDADTHPIYGTNVPSNPERVAWSGAFRHYDPTAGTHWGNRAKGATQWADAVNTFTQQPANQHPARRHDIGVMSGIVLQARCTSTEVRIFPRTPYADATFPAFTATPGAIDHTKLQRWLDHHHLQARIDRLSLTTAVQLTGATGHQQRPHWER